MVAIIVFIIALIISIIRILIDFKRRLLTYKLNMTCWYNNKYFLNFRSILFTQIK